MITRPRVSRFDVLALPLDASRVVPRETHPAAVYRDGRPVHHGPPVLLADGLTLAAARAQVWDAHPYAQIERTSDGAARLIVPPHPYPEENDA